MAFSKDIGLSKGSLLADVLRREPDLIEQLASCLDKEMRLIKNWKHFSRELKVDIEVITGLEQYMDFSPTIRLFEHLEITQPDLTIQQLKQALLDIGRNDLFRLLATNASCIDFAMVSEIITCTRNTDVHSPRVGLLYEIALALDVQSLILTNWSSLAVKLGVPRKTFKQFERRSTQSPTNQMFEYLAATHPQMTLKTLKEALKRMNRKDLLKILQNQEDEVLVKDVMTSDSELLQMVADKLNSDQLPWAPNCRKLSYYLKIPPVVNQGFGETAEQKSPTKEVLQWLVVRTPDITLIDIIQALEKIQRSDAIQIITQQFPDAVVVPSEINLRGRLALEAYNKALTEGKTCVNRVPVMLIGQNHSGNALMSHPPQDIIKLVASAHIPSLFLKFECGQVPPGLFSQLVLQFFQWGQDEFWSSENPQLYSNFARFYTSEDEDCSVILWCHSSSIEIVVHRPDMAGSLQSKFNISADAHYDAFEVACVGVIRRQLGLMLEYICEEFCWLKNMKYEEVFICSVCCQGHVVKLCCDHHKEGCEQEECLHFWSVSDLRGANQFVRCHKCATAQSNKIHIKQFEPWIETTDEQPTTDEHDVRLPAPEGGNDEKLFALPSEALKSLFSQTCDTKEVVLQLMNCLHLDQSSLDQPDPRTKRLIRCLATKAKQSNRLDVVKRLREITPPGTTGPLLPEGLAIRNIPVRQLTELTVELSGGEEWKLVAEELGLSSQEIRYIDKRTLNPCDAVLAYGAGSRFISVGCLYDMLNVCGLPVAADRL